MTHIKTLPSDNVITIGPNNPGEVLIDATLYVTYTGGQGETLTSFQNRIELALGTYLSEFAGVDWQ